MNEGENTNEHHPDIPDAFRTEEGTFFKHCISCNNELIESDTEYIIERAIKKYPKLDASAVIFEYALCMTCAEKMHERMSAESMQRLREYVQTHMQYKVDLFDRLEEDQPIEPTELLHKCLITGRPIDDESVGEYQMIAHCKGNKLSPWEFPFAICGEALEGMSALLSEKTRDELDDFIDDHFGLPPEWKEALKKRDPVFV